MTRFAGDKQHHLRAGQRRKFISLFHDASLALRERGVASEFVVYKLHFNFHPSFGFLAGRWAFPTPFK